MSDPVKTVTTVRELDADGDVVSEKITTTVTETIKQPETPQTGMYV